MYALKEKNAPNGEYIVILLHKKHTLHFGNIYVKTLIDINSTYIRSLAFSFFYKEDALFV